MSAFASLLGRKAARADKPSDAAQPDTAPRDDLELDQELFFPIASQLGEENEAVRNLLIGAEHKLNELDEIKKSVRALIEPVSKTLRAFEAAKGETLSLHSALNNARTANTKLRDDLAAAEKKSAVLEADGTRLRETLTLAQQSVSALESMRTEQSAELTARRAQIADLQQHVQQQAAELQAARQDAQRAEDRAASAERRMVQIETDAATAQQKCQFAEKERGATQAALDKALGEAAQLSRKLVETEKGLAAARTRLAQLEKALAEVQAERTRIATALDEASEKQRSEMAAQIAKFDALQARAQLSDKLLEEARQTLAARAEEVNSFDRRVSEAAFARAAIESKLHQLETALAQRDERIKELDELRATLSERNEELTRLSGSRENAYNRAQEKIQGQDDLIQLLEGQIKADREASQMQIDELSAQLQRERMERTMAEGALEAGRKDIARLLRELAAVQYQPGKPGQAQLPHPAPQQAPQAAEPQRRQQRVRSAA